MECTKPRALVLPLGSYTIATVTGEYCPLLDGLLRFLGGLSKLQVSLVVSMGRRNTIWYKTSVQRWCVWLKGNGWRFLRRSGPSYGAVGRQGSRCT
jgi:hypothetical protein